MNDLISRQDDLISRQAAIDCEYQVKIINDIEYVMLSEVQMKMRKLPSAEPKRGRWIYHIDDLFPEESTMECNQCHAEQPLTCDDEFCPHCGADMRGEQDGCPYQQTGCD